MTSLLRALAVMVAVTVAGTTLSSSAGQAASTSPADTSALNVAEATGPTPSELAVRRAEQARQQRETKPRARPSAPASARPSAPPSAPASPPAARKKPRKPLTAITIALDPGHQLGNHNFPRQINALVPAGGSSKPCNTTGTATNSGVAEATVNFQLATAVAKRLRKLGARVPMTRTTDSQQKWGPCVDQRGEFGKRVGARLMVSLHADGEVSSDYGFHVIAPTRRAPWTTDIATASLRLATALRNGLSAGGLPRSSYIGHGTALDVRDDLGTLNMSDVPVAMIEIGNMRNSVDARRMTSASGRARYAKAVVRGIRSYLGR